MVSSAQKIGLEKEELNQQVSKVFFMIIFYILHRQT